MYSVSQNFKNAIMSTSRILKAKVLINSREYDESYIVEMNYEDTSNPSGSFEIGTVASATLNISVVGVNEAFETATIKPYIGLDLGGTVEYVPLGVFYCDRVDRKKDVVTLTCYDGMIKLEKAYFSDLTYPATISAVMNEICTKAGIQFAGTLPNYSFSKKPEGYKFREVVAFIAQMCGGFAKFDRDGKLRIKSYTTTSETITADHYMDDGFSKKKDAVFRIDKITCQTGENTISKGTLSAGGSEVRFENPFMTDAIMTDIYNKLKGFQYLPVYLQFVGNPAYEVGDIVTLVTVDDETIQIPIMVNKLAFSGGLTGEIESVGETENSNQFDSSGSLTNKVERVVYELAFINEALINKATIEDLEATNARIDNLITNDLAAINAQIENLIANKASISDLEAINAEIENLRVGKADIEDLEAINARIDNLEVTKANISDLDAINAAIQNLQADKANITDLDAVNARIDNLKVTSAMIEDAAITTAKIAIGAITTALIAEGAIGTMQIADASITDAKIVELSASKLTAGTINTGQVTIEGPNGFLRILDNRIQIFDNSQPRIERVVMGDVNNDGSVYGFRVRGADGQTVLYDENGVYNEGITDGAITNPKIADGAVENRHITANTITGDKLVAGTITAREIKARSITANELATNTITAQSGVIADAAITTAMIADAAITNAKIDSLDASKITSGYISADRIAADSITAQKIAIADFTNLSQIDEDTNPNGNTVVTVNNKKYFRVGTGAYAKLSIATTKKVEFRVNDEYFIRFTGYRETGVTSVTFIIRYFYTDGSWANAGSVNVTPGTSSGTVQATVKITGAVDEAKTLNYIDFFFEKDSGTTGYYYVADIELRKRYAGELIVDGSITTEKLAAKSITADKLNVTSLSAISVDLGTVTAGIINGVQINGSTINGSNLRIDSTGVNGSSTYWLDKNGFHSKLNQNIPNYGSVTIDVWINDPSKNGGIIVKNSDTNQYLVMDSNGIAFGSTYEAVDGKVMISPYAIYAGNVYLNGANSILNDSPSTLWIAGVGGVRLNQTGVSDAFLEVNTDESGARIHSMGIYNRTYSGTANMFITPAGTLGRLTSARKYKEDIQEVDLSNGYAERILQLKPKSWFDKTEIAENGGSTIGLDRRYGLVAEDVVEAGLSEYVLFTQPDENGNREVDGIAYDRLWTLLIPVTKSLKNEQQAMKDEINWLKLENQYLKQKIQQLEAMVS